MFQRRENLSGAASPFFPKSGEKLSTFQTNKVKNESSILDFSVPGSDLKLMNEYTNKQRLQVESKIRELQKGLVSAEAVGLQESLRRR
jgi:hypothetical protein